VGELERPYSRSEFNRTLIANALLSPFNVLVLAGMLVAGLLLDAFLLVLPVALVVYGIAAARTYLDEDEAAKVLEREREKRRDALERGRLDPGALASPIRELLEGALQRERRIRDAIERAELPYAEVSTEVDRFVRAMEGTAARAQLLHEALSETPPASVERRLTRLRAEADPGKRELMRALEQQLLVQQRMDGQLRRFFTEMERVLVELDTVRGNLVSVSASTEAANQERLAGEVRGLREEVGALAEGMIEAYEPSSRVT
jgi:hypothetical protein